MKNFTLFILGIAALFVPTHGFTIQAQHLDQNGGGKEETEVSEGFEVYVSDVGFDKTLTLLVLESKESNIKLQIVDKSGSDIFASHLNVKHSNEIIVDLSFLPRGTYDIVLSQGENSYEESRIFP